MHSNVPWSIAAVAAVSATAPPQSLLAAIIPTSHNRISNRALKLPERIWMAGCHVKNKVGNDILSFSLADYP
jgi:hypothetical protein